MSRREDLLEEVARHEWFYRIDLGGGVVTPGRFGGPNPQIMEAFGQVDFRAKKVLDIGCFEGHWSFEAERRGAARVMATDYLEGDPRARRSESGVMELPTFRLAHAILGSSVDYRPGVSVYDIKQLDERDFDVVIFCGVYYHLKHPILALSRLREVIREGGTLIVEGPVIQGPSDSWARFLYHDVLGEDRSNWWVPTLPCLLEWIECSFFEVAWVSSPGHQLSRQVSPPPSPVGAASRSEGKRITETVVRHTALARAVTRKDWHYAYPDQDLHQYDRE